MQKPKNTVFLTLHIFAWILFLYVPVEIYALPSNKILTTSFHKTPLIETIEIQTIKEPVFDVTRLNDPKRIVFTIRDSYYNDLHYSQKTDGAKIDKYRISQNTENQTRLVIDLFQEADFKTETTPLNNGRYLLKIDIPNENDPYAIQPVLIAQLETAQPESSILSDGPKETALFNSLEPSSDLPADPELQPDPFQTAQSQEQTIDISNDAGFDDAIFDESDEIEEKKKDWNFSGLLQLRPSFDIQHDTENENKTSLRNRIILKADYKKKFIISGISDYLYFGSPNETDDYDIDFYELYYKEGTSLFDFSIGKQIKRWGKTDQISPIDTLNPSDIREFIVPPYEERKIPVWMADLVFKKDGFFIEGIFIPFFEPAKFHYFETDWALFPHLKNDMADSSLSSREKAYVDSISVNETLPSDGSDSFEYALRMGGTIKQVDFGFTYHYTNEDSPYFESFPVKNLSVENSNPFQGASSDPGSLILTNEYIETTYLRTNIFGFEFETILSDFGIRGEAAFRDNESFLTSSFTSVRNPSLIWIIGADYTTLNDWYFNLQFGHQHISDYDSSIIFFEKDNFSVIGEVNKDLFSGWLNAAFQYTFMLSDGSYYLSPRFVYSYINNLELILGLSLFEGPDDSILGRYDEDDQVFIDLKYFF